MTAQLTLVDEYETQAKGALQPAPHKFSRRQISERVTEAKRQKQEKFDAVGYVPEKLEVRNIAEHKTGVYYALNALTSGQNSHRGVVTVKLRSRPGEPLVCLTCLVNECKHTRFVEQYIEQHGEV